MAPQTAQRLGLADEDVVDLKTPAGSVRAPVWTLPGHAPDCVTIPFGFGRTVAGHVGRDVGFDGFRLRPHDAPWHMAGLEVRKSGARHPLATTQHHQMMEGSDIVRTGTLDEFRKDPHFAQDREPQPSLYPDYDYTRNAWAMAIDLNACIGCSACTAACQAENNIAVVGKEEVLRNRQMHWIRVDRWFAGPAEAPEEILFQPVPCMHCEHAPCEIVCSVEATVHDSDGLNVMVYNRCVGTRFCSNNCPYKVRRFN